MRHMHSLEISLDTKDFRGSIDFLGLPRQNFEIVDSCLLLSCVLAIGLAKSNLSWPSGFFVDSPENFIEICQNSDEGKFGNGSFEC